MAEEKEIALTELDFNIKDKIHTIRGIPVMLDSDLARIYGYDTRSFNKQIKNNARRFEGDEFSFLLTEKEFKNLMCKKSTSSWGGRRKLPRVFTESGVYMLMTVLRGDLAVKQSRALIVAFKAMRHFLSDNSLVFQRLDRIELKLLETDDKFNQIFEQLESSNTKKTLIFFQGQLWDATSCIEEINSKAEESIILIDNYVDRNTLDLLSRKKPGVSVSIYTMKRHCELSEKERQDFNSQYGPLEIRYTDQFHARFLIIDRKTNYHVEASLKDAGAKAFAITVSEDEDELKEILNRL